MLCWRAVLLWQDTSGDVAIWFMNGAGGGLLAGLIIEIASAWVVTAGLPT